MTVGLAARRESESGHCTTAPHPPQHLHDCVIAATHPTTPLHSGAAPQCVLHIPLPPQPRPHHPHQALHHCLTHHGSFVVWLLPLTPVDYLSVPPDIKPGFADRFLRAYEARRPSASQLLLQTFLFLGFPQVPLQVLHRSPLQVPHKSHPRPRNSLHLSPSLLFLSHTMIAPSSSHRLGYIQCVPSSPPLTTPQCLSSHVLPPNASALLIQRYQRRTNHSDGVSLSP
ncbi:unnamed protein product [Closterium sp. Naga37s-1]|nr:unnamed protein product [Closterium sp. Naga37s-1]